MAKAVNNDLDTTIANDTLNDVNYENEIDVAPVDDDDNSSEYNQLPGNNNTAKRRKTKHPLSKQTLRRRKIHSLKRQIHIKEKMLEVNLLSNTEH